MSGYGTETCPEHGTVKITDPYAGATRGPDPYNIVRLACGHVVTALGPDPEDIYIVATRR